MNPGRVARVALSDDELPGELVLEAVRQPLLQIPREKLSRVDANPVCVVLPESEVAKNKLEAGCASFERGLIDDAVKRREERMVKGHACWEKNHAIRMIAVRIKRQVQGRSRFLPSPEEHCARVVEHLLHLLLPEGKRNSESCRCSPLVVDASASIVPAIVVPERVVLHCTVVENAVEKHGDALLVGGVDKGPELLRRPVALLIGQT